MRELLLPAGLPLVASVLIALSSFAEDRTTRLDPPACDAGPVGGDGTADTAWGDDHVGKPLPAYMTGDECLFCHRKIGPTWSSNRHQLTIRPASPDEPAVRLLRELPEGNDIAAETRYLLGSQRITRFLRRSKQYGKLDMLSASFIPKSSVSGQDAKAERDRADEGTLRDRDSLQWDETTFAARCAGCHTTAVKTATRSFSALSLDCFTCHGDVNLDHTKDVRRVLLSGKNRRPREVVSICGQCHLRGGSSKSSRLPYPNTFVAGDNLFRDFQVNFSDAAIEALPPQDQHIFLSAREVVVFDKARSSESDSPTGGASQGTNCLTCHQVHSQSSEKHQQLENASICSACHVPDTDNTKLRAAMFRLNRLRAHSRTCDY